MAKITRQTLLVFGINAGGADIGVFGSLAAGSPTYSNVISTIQSLPAWGTGWAAETIATNRPALEDMNAVCHVLSYGICYLHEMGIPEWDYGTTYYTNSYAQVNGMVYISLQDNNTNHDPTASSTYWALAFLTGSYLDTDIILAANSDSRIATQRATKTYVDNKGISSSKIYDTGWFAISWENNYTKTHNLGTTKSIVQIWFSPNSDGSAPCYLQNGYMDQDQHGRLNLYQIFVTSLTATQITVAAGGSQGAGYNKICIEWDGSSVQQYVAGYCRIVILALE